MKLAVRPAFAMDPADGRIAPGNAKDWIIALATNQPPGWEAGILAIVSFLMTRDADNRVEDYGIEAVKHLLDTLGLDVLLKPVR